MLQSQKRHSRTQNLPPPALPHGVLEKYIKAILDIYEVGSVDFIAGKFPKHLQRPALKTSVQYAVGQGVAKGWLVRPCVGVYALADGGVTWRRVFELTRPDLTNITRYIGGNWATTTGIENYMRRHRGVSSTQQVLVLLRWLKKRGIVWKSGRSDWRLTPELDKPCK